MEQVGPLGQALRQSELRKQRAQAEGKARHAVVSLARNEDRAQGRECNYK